MNHSAGTTFEVKSWDEDEYDAREGERKLTRARVVRAYEGALEGEGHAEYLMMYRDDGSAGFVGLERVVGTLGDRSGSFVLQHIGTYEDGVVRETLSVVAGSGTAQLLGLVGGGVFESGRAAKYPMTLHYDYE